jgi:hypothetical protein
MRVHGLIEFPVLLCEAAPFSLTYLCSDPCIKSETLVAVLVPV